MASKICPECGAINEPTDLFCKECGASLANVSAANQPTTAFTPLPSANHLRTGERA